MRPLRTLHIHREAIRAIALSHRVTNALPDMFRNQVIEQAQPV
jgi:hypothetical protein